MKSYMHSEWTYAPGLDGICRAAADNFILAYIDICVDMIKCVAFGRKQYIIKNGHNYYFGICNRYRKMKRIFAGKVLHVLDNNVITYADQAV